MTRTLSTAWALAVWGLIAVATATAETVHPGHGPALASQAQALAAPPLPPPPPPPPECREPEVPKLTVIDTTSSRIRLRATVQSCEEYLSLERQHGDEWQKVGQGQNVDPLSPFPFEVTDTDRQPSTTYCYRAVGTIGDQSAMSTTECGTTDAAQLEVPMVFAASASVISEYGYTVDRDNVRQQVTFLTTDLSPGSDPVLHLLDPSGQEVAVADTGGPGVAEQLTYTPQAGGTYRLVVRARSNTTDGTCNLTMNGGLWKSGVVFGGWHTSLPALRTDESVETVKLPNGATGRHLLFVLKANGLGIELRDYGNGTGGAAALKLTVPLGDRTVVVGVNAWGTPGAVRLIRNDAEIPGHDLDQDGLGNELEKALGTCSTRTGSVDGFDCSRVADARDTDGDGIPDDWEVRGRRDLKPHQPLPLWGANPRHKDLFIEMDFMLRSPGEQPQKMTPAVARQFARFYQDEIGNVSPLLRKLHAASLRNPDLEPGIAVHIDTGVPPADPKDATLYGDWGGYTAVPPIMDADGNWDDVDYRTAWQTPMGPDMKPPMAPARRGIFRHGLPYATGGGQTGINSFAFTFGIADAWLGAHELGHGMGLDHNGPDRATGEGDPNCKPNYPSILNYAYDDSSVSFSDGLPGFWLNNAALQETNAVNPSHTAYLDDLQNRFDYWVDRATGSVDWNRDGEMAPADQRVRAYANFKPGNSAGCEYTRLNQTQVSDVQSERSPAMARLGNRLYVFFNQVLLRYTHSTSSWDCPVPSNDPCGTWNGPKSVNMDGSQGVDVIGIRPDTLLVVTIDGAGNVWEARLTVDPAGQEHWTMPTLLETGAAGEPALARITNAETYLAFRGTDDRLRWKALHPSAGGWQPTQVGQATNGSFITLAGYASPGLVGAYLPWKTGKALYGAFPNASGRLQVWGFDRLSGRWEDTQLVKGAPGPVGTRPALAWVPYQESADYPGRLYIIWSDHNATEPIQRMMMSYVRVRRQTDGSLERTEEIGLLSPFDNTWSYAYGSDLLFERGVDTNLRSVHTHATAGYRYQIWFRPKADGIHDFAYRDYNDWEYLGYGLCRNVVNPGNLVADPPEGEGQSRIPIKCLE